MTKNTTDHVADINDPVRDARNSEEPADETPEQIADRLLRTAGNPVALAYAQGYAAGLRRQTSP